MGVYEVLFYNHWYTEMNFSKVYEQPLRLLVKKEHRMYIKDFCEFESYWLTKMSIKMRHFWYLMTQQSSHDN